MCDLQSDLQSEVTEKLVGARILYTENYILDSIGRLVNQCIIPDMQEIGGKWKVICLLNGAYKTFTHLVDKLPLSVEIGFVKASSYGNNKTSGNLSIEWCGIDKTHLDGYNIILVDDVCDTGKTLSAFKSIISKFTVCKTMALLDKTTNHEESLTPDYVAIKNVPADSFLVGFGLDMEGQARNLPHIYDIKR